MKTAGTHNSMLTRQSETGRQRDRERYREIEQQPQRSEQFIDTMCYIFYRTNQIDQP